VNGSESGVRFSAELGGQVGRRLISPSGSIEAAESIATRARVGRAAQGRGEWRSAACWGSLTPRIVLHSYARILETCEPYLVATRLIADRLGTTPLGVEIPAANRFDPQVVASAAFLSVLRRYDAVTFGPFGMQMPQWVFYDCAVMPGAVFGLGTRASLLEPWAREALGLPPDYDGLVPLSAFIAIPMLEGATERRDDAPPPSWLVYTLHSINAVSPGIGPEGLLELTFALGLRVFPIKTLYGVSQWRNPRLGVYAGLGPLELMTAYTPAHSLPRTLCFRAPVASVALDSLLVGPSNAPAPNAFLDVDDVPALRRLQTEIEEGVRYDLVGPPQTRGTYVLAPLFRRPR